jgi:hypothetical protein
MTANHQGQGPIQPPPEDEKAGFAQHAPYISRALDALPPAQAASLRAAMEERKVEYAERDEGLAIIVDGFELCIVPGEVADPIAYPSSPECE